MHKIKFIILTVLVFAVRGRADGTTSETNRQKRFLFYDEEGHLVNAYGNSLLRNFFLNPNNYPFFGALLSPFFNFLRPLNIGGVPACYMIPVSDNVIQNINKDPANQNKLVLSRKEPVIEPNALCAGRRGSFPSPKSCRAFLDCWDGWAFQQECPQGLLFSNAGFCDYADNVDCKNRMIPSSSRSTCSRDFETFRNQYNCNEFFVCVNRQPIKFKCPANLAYSERLGVCDYADNVNCRVYQADLPVEATPPPLPISTPTIPSSNVEPTIPSLPTFAPSKDMGNTFIIKNSIYNSESLIAGHEASSREDAIRQLLSSFIKVE
ncbi:uncharacterized protein LOC113522672 [Galleria mellonella]|uniref:Uncharacterized protein LOC113522672 n=1 Tax=Galleria mellonella TaxID=7137 RepID=A0A6J1X3V6_GALME|nr:uncharacterized protein LOC113522672 [Galleria mellonella]